MIEITTIEGYPIELVTANIRRVRGLQLPGADLFQAGKKKFQLSVYEYTKPFFHLSLRSVHCSEKQSFVFKESHKGLRLEFTLSGGLYLTTKDGNLRNMTANQYHLTTDSCFRVDVEPDRSCHYLVSYLSPEYLGRMSISDRIGVCEPRNAPAILTETVDDLLTNTYTDPVRNQFYDNCLSQILFWHVAIPKNTTKGELSAKESAIVQEVDRIIAQNIDVHHSIEELAAMVNTNECTLKENFATVFGMGPFERLRRYRMDRAKNLLAATDDQIQEIALKAGYRSVTGFIHAFKDIFGLTPRQWRRKSRGEEP